LLYTFVISILLFEGYSHQ